MALRVLVAEDEPVLLEVASLILRASGHEVLEATDGLRALRVARDARPDVALIDVMMPGLDGREVARTLRDDEELRGTRIVLYSSLGEGEIEWQSSGADAFRSKSEDIRELPGFLESLVNG